MWVLAIFVGVANLPLKEATRLGQKICDGDGVANVPAIQRGPK
jgi:hypothetical protein